MCALHKVAAFLFFTLLLFHPSPTHAQSPEENPVEELLTKVRLIEERVRRIEANQQEILAREEKILAELDRLRIWVHRR